MSRGPLDHPKAGEKRANNVLVEDARAVVLRCGHATRAHPTATRPNGRRLYWCDECRELLEAKR